MTIVLKALATALAEAAKFNKSVQATRAAVLWTDAESQWLPLIPRLRESGLVIVSLGEYQWPP